MRRGFGYRLGRCGPRRDRLMHVTHQRGLGHARPATDSVGIGSWPRSLDSILMGEMHAAPVGLWTAPDPAGLRHAPYCRSNRRRSIVQHGRARPTRKRRANLHARSARVASRHTLPCRPSGRHERPGPLPEPARPAVPRRRRRACRACPADRSPHLPESSRPSPAPRSLLECRGAAHPRRVWLRARHRGPRASGANPGYIARREFG